MTPAPLSSGSLPQSCGGTCCSCHASPGYWGFPWLGLPPSPFSLEQAMYPSGGFKACSSSKHLPEGSEMGTQHPLIVGDFPHLPCNSVQFSLSRLGLQCSRQNPQTFLLQQRSPGGKIPLNHHSKSLPIPDCAVETPTTA